MLCAVFRIRYSSSVVYISWSVRFWWVIWESGLVLLIVWRLWSLHACLPMCWVKSWVHCTRLLIGKGCYILVKFLLGGNATLWPIKPCHVVGVMGDDCFGEPVVLFPIVGVLKAIPVFYFYFELHITLTDPWCGLSHSSLDNKLILCSC